MGEFLKRYIFIRKILKFAYIPRPCGLVDRIQQFDARNSANSGDILTITGDSGITLRKFLSIDARESEMVLFRKHERTVRRIRDDAFIERLERLLVREHKLESRVQKL